MPRGNRHLYPGAIFHVMNRGLAHRDVFLTQEDFLSFIEIFSNLELRFRVSVIAYCLMPNHFHLLMKDEDCRLSEALKHLSWQYVFHFNRRQDRDGPLFRGRFKSVRIESSNQLRHTIEYIHFNPVKAELSSTPEEWPWSSAKSALQTPVEKLRADWFT